MDTRNKEVKFFEISSGSPCDCGWEKNSDLSTRKHRARNVNFARPWTIPGRARIIPYDRSLLKSVPIKGFARKWRKLRAKGHRVERDRVRIDPAIGLFSGSSHKRPGSRTRGVAHKQSSARGCFANPTNQADTSHRRPV